MSGTVSSCASIRLLRADEFTTSRMRGGARLRPARNAPGAMTPRVASRGQRRACGIMCVGTGPPGSSAGVQGAGAVTVVPPVAAAAVPEPAPVQEAKEGFYGMPAPGAPLPMGANLTSTGSTNFAVYAPDAVAVSLCLYTRDDLTAEQVTCEIPLIKGMNNTGAVWHVELPGLNESLLYGWRVAGSNEQHLGHRHDATRVVLDPYATTVVSRPTYGVPAAKENCWPQMASAVPSAVDDFDWEGDVRCQHKEEDLIVYEMHVRGFTKDPSSGVTAPGTYAGMSERLQHIASMGITAVELMPIHEFNELEYYSLNPVTGEHRFNFWGYSTVGFNAPMVRYAAAGDADNGRAAVRELKQLVKDCHSNGLEVILDVVYNHTAEGNELGPVISFRGLANRVYYVVAPQGQFYNYSGCGNTFNCNHPAVRQFILDSLRYWVTEFHVDGFRFDLASIMTRASSTWEHKSMFGEGSVHMEPGWGEAVVTGTPLGEPPLIEMISADPVLKGTRLIAEAWDAGGLYQVGTFPHYGRWAEWNGKFRDTVRNFLKGTDGFVGDFAEMLCGSPNLYQAGGRQPFHSVNFVTAHDGFTMMDMVSYNEKHNEANGENNNDGEEHNLSWNCGLPNEEGDAALPATVDLRTRQVRNHFVALMVAQGTPMILMGDEYGHSKKGNNNTYCHDNALNYFKWDELQADEGGLARFVRCLTQLRRSHGMLGVKHWVTEQDLSWHSEKADEQPDWSETGRFLAFMLHPPPAAPAKPAVAAVPAAPGRPAVPAQPAVPAVPGEPPLYVAFNASFETKMVELPQLPHGMKWSRVLDTAATAPFDISNDELPAELLYAAEVQIDKLLAARSYPMLDHSSIILKAVPA